MKTFISKITSRKLWAAVIGFITPLLIFMGVSTTQAEKIALIVMAGAVLIGYIFGQGLVDAATAGSPTLISDANVSADATAVATNGNITAPPSTLTALQQAQFIAGSEVGSVPESNPPSTPS